MRWFARITAIFQRIADGGVNAAEQATMTLDALNAALGQTYRRGDPSTLPGAAVGLPASEFVGFSEGPRSLA